MDKRGNPDSPSTSRNDSDKLNDSLMGVLQSVVESQQQQLKICSKVHTLACDIERGLEEKNKGPM